VLSEWASYIEARKAGIKPRWKSLLDERFKYLESLDNISKKKYIHDICCEYFNNGHTDIPIQNPRIWNHVIAEWKSKLPNKSVQHLIWAFKAISFKGVYTILNIDSKEILGLILSIEPDNEEARKLFFQVNLNSLDFAMHELPCALVIDEDVCFSIIRECDAMLELTPSLSACITRFNGDYTHYRSKFLSWIEYEKKGIEIDFYKWLQEKI